MTFYFRNGTSFRPTDEANVNIVDKLPPKTFTIRKHPMTGELYLEIVDSFTKPLKIYGNFTKKVNKIFNTFMSRDSATGVLLAGEKGSGKTLLARLLSIKAAEQNIPTIVINTDWAGEEFNMFIQSIDQEVVVLFDEFEKVYDEQHQEKILTLLDGVYPSKKLFILTCNDTYRIDRHMKNRPGRIFYMLNFDGVDIDFITEYLNDNLNNKQHIPLFVKIAATFNKFNFDILKAIVEEMNRYDEGPKEALEMLNARPYEGDSRMFDIALFINDIEIPTKFHYPRSFDGTPISDAPIKIKIDTAFFKTKKGTEVKKLFNFESKNKQQYNTKNVIQAYPADPFDDSCNDEDADASILLFTTDDLKDVNAKEGVFTFINEQKAKVIFIQRKTYSFNYNAF